MGIKRSAGLFLRKGIWHVDKQVFGLRLRETTGSSLLSEAERFLARKVEELRQATVYGIRPKRTFREATEKYLKENLHKASIADDVYWNVHVKSTQLLAQHAIKQMDFKRFLHVSTVGVHGHIENPPANEESAFSPGDVYQKTKVEGELWL